MPTITAKIHFYYFAPRTFLEKIQTAISFYSHVNVEVDGYIFDLSRHGGYVYKPGEYPPEPNWSIDIVVPKKDFNTFVGRFTLAGSVRYSRLCYVMALFFRRYDNCATSLEPLVGRRCATPDKLLEYMEKQINGHTKQDSD
jgi:hypothetical protein